MDVESEDTMRKMRRMMRFDGKKLTSKTEAAVAAREGRLPGYTNGGGNDSGAEDDEYMKRFVERQARRAASTERVGGDAMLNRRRGSICGTGVAPRKSLGASSKDRIEASKRVGAPPLLSTGLSGSRLDARKNVERSSSARRHVHTSPAARRAVEELLEPERGWSISGYHPRLGAKDTAASRTTSTRQRAMRGSSSASHASEVSPKSAATRRAPEVDTRRIDKVESLRRRFESEGGPPPLRAAVARKHAEAATKSTSTTSTPAKTRPPKSGNNGGSARISSSVEKGLRMAEDMARQTALAEVLSLPKRVGERVSSSRLHDPHDADCDDASDADADADEYVDEDAMTTAHNTSLEYFDARVVVGPVSSVDDDEEEEDDEDDDKRDDVPSRRRHGGGGASAGPVVDADGSEEAMMLQCVEEVRAWPVRSRVAILDRLVARHAAFLRELFALGDEGA